MKKFIYFKHTQLRILSFSDWISFKRAKNLMFKDQEKKTRITSSQKKANLNTKISYQTKASLINTNTDSIIYNRLKQLFLKSTNSAVLQFCCGIHSLIGEKRDKSVMEVFKMFPHC